MRNANIRWSLSSVPWLVVGCLAGACGPSGSSNNNDDKLDERCPHRCTSFGWEECIEPGEYAAPVACEEDEVCINSRGCKTCIPETTYCAGDQGNEVHQCSKDGRSGGKVETCQGDSVCSNGVCKDACAKAEDEASNVGCHFWSVDLDNEAFVASGFGGIGKNDAAAQQYAIAVANNNSYSVTAKVFRNNARVGEPLQEELVREVSIPPHDLVQIDLDQREVDGTMGQQSSYTPYSGSGTFVSSHGYRLETSGPVVAYQFNPIVQQYSNDASILIPRQALGHDYYVLGHPTANPCAPPPGDPLHRESLPDYTAITVVGTEDGTQVTVVPTHPVRPSQGDSGIAIPATPAGQPITFTVNRYDVVNLESDQPQVSTFECVRKLDQDGDFTGSTVRSSKPVVVFSSLERAGESGGVSLPRPPNWDGKNCCTDHLEQQMFPTNALGWQFAVSRSPLRSTDPDYKEPDIYRVLATVDNTEVTTSLDGDFASFQLNAGEFKAFYSDHGFTLQATGGAVMLGQFLVQQSRIPRGGIGDPTFVVFPAAEQHRKDYVFLVPETFTVNYMVLAKPVDAAVTLDSAGLPSACTTEAVGEVNGVSYDQTTCALTEGVHTVSGDKPFGLTVYGYYAQGSYGYPGGSDVKIINPID